ncbi:MAG: IMPACT family protein [candidate division KSB1 bacterium]|nr:IMPACT family protein [candidate division KSB1 bacterium]
MAEYFSIKTSIEAELKVKGSRFIAFLCAVKTRQEAEAQLAARARHYREATHHCYAYRLGFDDSLVYKSSDAGEPPGTAGRPILQALEKSNLTNTLAIVTRYFGGTKLGTGGLARAYRAATIAAIEQAQLAPAFLKQTLRLRYAYPLTAVVQKILHHLEAETIAEVFGAEVEHTVALRASRLEEAQQQLRATRAGKILVELILSQNDY